jgi:Kef-type K+ transport system membrane component KefB
MTLSPELTYVGILFALFVVPRALQRLGIPTAITSLALGVATGMGLGLFTHDTTLHLLSAFGIVALFLFAGLDVEVEDLRTDGPVIVQHLAHRGALLLLVAYGLVRGLHLEVRVATLLALALLTPSTGFILDSIGQFDLDPVERRWIKTKAIATELLALLVMFGTLQSTTLKRMTLSIAVLAGMIALLPAVFRGFARLVVPFAPRSEFAFLLMLAVACSFVTRELGVYYLIGAFVVGMAAQRFRKHLPAIASEQMVHAVEMFASFFVPFYFFGAGLQLRREDVTVESLAYGAGFLALMLPLRVLSIAVHRRLSLREGLRSGARIAVAMLPTLVFGLVIADILRERFAVPAAIYGGLILYTLLTTIVPALFFHRPPPEFLEPHAPRVGPEEDAPTEPSEAKRPLALP